MQVVIVKEHFLSIGIAVLLLMVLFYGVSTIVPPPNPAVFLKDTPRYISKSGPRYPAELEKRIELQKEDYQTVHKKYRSIVCSIIYLWGF